MTDRILTVLLSGKVISGTEICEAYGVTRAAIWKQVEKLREEGFVIETVGKQGYHLTGCPDSLRPPMIREGLSTHTFGKTICFEKEVDSTNRLARKLAAEGADHGTLVVADAQNAGRGRRGRSWQTPAGEAIAMSVILRPSMHPSSVSMLSLYTAIAVAQGIRRVTGLDARIKWPNDIVCNARKCVGMLLEMDADEQMITSVVAGIGINVHQKNFDEEYAGRATSLDLLTQTRVSRAAVVREVLTSMEELEKALEDGKIRDIYRSLSATLGREIQVIGVNETFTGKAVDVLEDGSLQVQLPDGSMRNVLSGDVSVRGLMGYV